MSLTTCLKKAGQLLEPEVRVRVLERAAALRREGKKASEASLQAVDEELAEVEALIKGWKPAPKEEAKPAPKPAPVKAEPEVAAPVEAKPAAEPAPEPQAKPEPKAEPQEKGERKFYVTMIRDTKVARLAGPFDTKEEAEARVDDAREEANKADFRSAFDEVCGSVDVSSRV